MNIEILPLRTLSIRREYLRQSSVEALLPDGKTRSDFSEKGLGRVMIDVILPTHESPRKPSHVRSTGYLGEYYYY